MAENQDSPGTDGEDNEEEQADVPSILEQVRTTVEIVWIIARLLGM
ncbi:hypothetical protein [Halomicrobium zhouii]|nr:hypothetical protein [Halomicrobium zhouii]